MAGAMPARRNACFHLVNKHVGASSSRGQDIYTTRLINSPTHQFTNSPIHKFTNSPIEA